ncbi:Solute carrier family 40 member 1-like [Homarus americanus]|uniref:Solute carrier family 40 member n=2 Tax=Homarus americanus TaxID=6706 RepID=A0A8J5JUE9_HOMAM|nr:Solute carrier family 40 member 1-like [Homarus americanus]
MSREDLQMMEGSAVTGLEANDDQEQQSEKPENEVSPSNSRNHYSTPTETYRKLDEEFEDTSKQKDNTTRISEEPDENEGRHCCQRCRSATFQVYASHFLSSWGDRMWMFAGGLFLLEVTPGSLRLAAVYGAALALTVIICGAPVGRWIDRTSRLRTAQLSLSIQNIMVCFCAAILVLITTQRQIFTAWDGWSLVVAEGFVILTACIAQIGTLGSKLAIEKDWILVICGQDNARLAGMNSVLRSVDLSTEVLAPVIVGAIMTGFGMAAGGIAIACWNVASLFVEYSLLHHLFYSNTDLQKPKKIDEGTPKAEGNAEDSHGTNEVKNKIKMRHKIVLRIISAWEAWRSYMNHPVRDAGLGLALLFMTVLAFDNYSRAFVYESGVSESILGVLTALASLFGIFGSIASPFLRKKIGVTNTGLVGFGIETFCLTFCVASVFSPGSPFDSSAILNIGKSSSGLTNSTRTAPSYFMSNVATPPSDFVETDIINLNVSQKVIDDAYTVATEEVNYTSVILFLTGIITSRFGLWVADLTVTQILQEEVAECERGAINGVQSSLNQSLDLLRSILIIILPTRETFGFLVILSFIFVFTAWIIFATYARRHSTSTPPVATPEAEELQAAV